MDALLSIVDPRLVQESDYTILADSAKWVVPIAFINIEFKYVTGRVLARLSHKQLRDANISCMRLRHQ